MPTTGRSFSFDDVDSSKKKENKFNVKEVIVSALKSLNLIDISSGYWVGQAHNYVIFLLLAYCLRNMCGMLSTHSRAMMSDIFVFPIVYEICVVCHPHIPEQWWVTWFIYTIGSHDKVCYHYNTVMTDEVWKIRI